MLGQHDALQVVVVGQVERQRDELVERDWEQVQGWLRALSDSLLVSVRVELEDVRGY